MEVKAHLNSLRISPRKIRLVVDLVRKMNIDEARKQLEAINKKSTEPILKLINSAVANAKNNFDLKEDDLYISEIFVNDGQVFKRWRPRAMGRAARILKRTSCVTVVLDKMASSSQTEGTKNLKEKEVVLEKDIKKTANEENIKEAKIIEKENNSETTGGDKINQAEELVKESVVENKTEIKDKNEKVDDTKTANNNEENKKSKDK